MEKSDSTLSVVDFRRSVHSIPSDLSPVLKRLTDAYRLAEQLRHDLWDFAIELTVLESTECSRSELRWLLCRGFLIHGFETTDWSDQKRHFSIVENLSMGENSCFVLTPKGYRFAVDELDRKKSLHEQISQGSSATQNTPSWDSERHEFRLGSDLVKQFRLPSPNQERVLTAFQEEGWPARIDDPLPPRSDIDPKRRLHDTIKSLNRNQKRALIRFHGDGTGQGVRWGILRP